jgi:hypothetical protein
MPKEKGGLGDFKTTITKATTTIYNYQNPLIKNENIEGEITLILKTLLIIMIIICIFIIICLSYCCIKMIRRKIKEKRKRRQQSNLAQNSFFQEEMTTFDISHVPNENSFIKINI